MTLPGPNMKQRAYALTESVRVSTCDGDLSLRFASLGGNVRLCSELSERASATGSLVQVRKD